MMISRLCKFTKNHSTIRLKWMNFTEYINYPSIKLFFLKKISISIWIRIKELDSQNTFDVTLSDTGNKRALKMLYAYQLMAWSNAK